MRWLEIKTRRKMTMAMNEIPIRFAFEVEGVLTSEKLLEAHPQMTIDIGCDDQNKKLALVATIMRNIEMNISDRFGITIEQYDLIRSFISKELSE